jgi:hypothetical protein
MAKTFLKEPYDMDFNLMSAALPTAASNAGESL